MIHRLWVLDASRSSVSVGNAVYRIELSRVISRSPAPTVTSSDQRRRFVIVDMRVSLIVNNNREQRKCTGWMV